MHALGLQGAAAVDSYPLRTGLWTTQRLPNDTASMKTFAANVAASRDLTGVSLHIPWSALEKKSGEFDFHFLDDTIAILRQKHLKYQLCLKPGTDTPSFVYAAGAHSFTTHITNPHRPNFGAKVTIPIPWDPIYERDFSLMIKELGARYANDPLCVSVVLTCANYLSAEMHLPKTRADLKNWSELGDYGAKLLAVYQRYTDDWAKAFPRQELCLHISKVLDLPSDFCAKVVDYCLKSYSQRFALQSCQLNGRREDTGMMTYDLILRYRDRTHHGFQSLAGLTNHNERMGSMEMAALNLVHATADYWELWNGDGFNLSTCAAANKTWKEARDLGYQSYKSKLIAEGKYLDDGSKLSAL
jgi:hypothetical protein